MLNLNVDGIPDYWPLLVTRVLKLPLLNFWLNNSERNNLLKSFLSSGAYALLKFSLVQITIDYP